MNYVLDIFKWGGGVDPIIIPFRFRGEGIIRVVCVILATHNSKKAAEERADAAPVFEHAHPAVRVQRMGVLRNCPSRRECVNYIASKRAHVEGACARARAPTRARERWARAVHFKNESHISSNLISQNLISAATVHLPEDNLITRASQRVNDSPDDHASDVDSEAGRTPPDHEFRGRQSDADSGRQKRPRTSSTNVATSKAGSVANASLMEIGSNNTTQNKTITNDKLFANQIPLEAVRQSAGGC